MSTTASAAPAPAKVSWLKKFGQILGKVLGVIATSAKPIADIAAPVAEALLPQFSSQIQKADNLVSNIAQQAIITEGVAAAAASSASTGPQKLEAVLANIGPEIDNWVSSNFPGAKAVSSANKAGLVNAVVAILNEVDPAAAVPTPAPTA